jgi:hypothetical protein
MNPSLVLAFPVLVWQLQIIGDLCLKDREFNKTQNLILESTAQPQYSKKPTNIKLGRLPTLRIMDKLKPKISSRFY